VNKVGRSMLTLTMTIVIVGSVRCECALMLTMSFYVESEGYYARLNEVN